MMRLDLSRMGPLRIGLLALLLGCCSLGRLAAQTGTFIDRQLATDLRMMSYNVWVTSIFPDVNQVQADKFVRVVNALDPDILNLQEVNRSAVDVVNLMNSVSPIAGGTWYAHSILGRVIASKYPLSMLATSVDPNFSRSPAIALVDLPDAQFGKDFYIINHHFVSSITNIDQRQRHADATISWIRDARTPGGSVDLPPGTPIAIVGDHNNFSHTSVLNTLVTGDIINESTYGPDSPPDWDGSSFTDSHPLNNGSGPDDYTFRYTWGRERIDHIIYSDSVLDVANKFVLNTVDMSPAELAATGLQPFDVTIDSIGDAFDHLPITTDFRLLDFTPVFSADFNNDTFVDGLDLALWEQAFGNSIAGDANSDGVSDGKDFLIWQEQSAVVPVSADFNNDTFVDGLDLALWEQAHGNSIVGDANNDGVSDGKDFLIWEQQFTGTAPLVPLTQVPEQASWLLFCGAIVVFLTSRVERSCSRPITHALGLLPGTTSESCRSCG